MHLPLGNSSNKLIIGKGPFAGLSRVQSAASCLKVRRVALILAQKPRYPTPLRSHSGEIARSKGIAIIGCCKMPGQLIRTLLVRILFSGTPRFLCQNQLARWNFSGTNPFHGRRADLQHAWLTVSQLFDLRVSSFLLVGAESYPIFRAKLVCAPHSSCAVRNPTTRALLAKGD